MESVSERESGKKKKKKKQQCAGISSLNRKKSGDRKGEKEEVKSEALCRFCFFYVFCSSSIEQTNII